MQNVKNTMIDHLLGLVAPHLCSGCGKTGSLLCDNCKSYITDRPFENCVICGQPSSVGVCQKHGLPYQKVWVVGERNGTLQRLIGLFKFQNAKAAARELGDLLDYRLPDLPSNTVIVPIPTASSHVRERGYDHAKLIAQYLASKRQLPLEVRLLGRADTKTQHSASRKDRIAQATSAFRLLKSVNPSLNYLIVDDVFTTGSTVLQAGRLIAGGGATTIWMAALAHQPLD